MTILVQVSDGQYNPFDPKYKTIEKEVIVGGGVQYRLTEVRLASMGKVLEIDEVNGLVLLERVEKTGSPATAVWIPQDFISDVLSPNEYGIFRATSVDDDGKWADKETIE